MTLDQFVTKYLGKPVDFDGHYGNQCVDLFRFYVKEVLMIPQPAGVVGAKDFYLNYDKDPILKTYFSRIANTPTGVPQKGDVILFDKTALNPYGHVGIFLQGDMNKFTSLDQNWSYQRVEKVTHNYISPKVLGWLRFKGNVIDPMLKDTVIDWNDGEGKKHEVGWYVYEWYAEKKRANDLEEENKQLVAELDKLRSSNDKLVQANAKLTTENTEITGKNIALMNEITKLNGSVKDMELTVAEKNEVIADLNAEIGEVRQINAELEAKLNSFLDSLTLGDFISWVGRKLGIKK